jgi:hypothetical protein
LGFFRTGRSGSLGVELVEELVEDPESLLESASWLLWRTGRSESWGAVLAGAEAALESLVLELSSA